MHELSDLLTAETILCDVRTGSKKQVLQELSRVMADRLSVDARTICEAVNAREQLGPTGVGNGVAVPHARIPGITRMAGAFARLTDPADFDGPDGRPADLIFLLLAPEDAHAEHLRTLARVARSFRKDEFCNALRAAPNCEALRAILTLSAQSDAA